MKKILILTLLILIIMTSCRDIINPVDPESDNYVGFESLDYDGDGIGSYEDVDEIAIAGPENGIVITDTASTVLIIQLLNPEVVTFYRIQISTDSSFVSNVFDSSTLTSNVFTVPAGTLANNTTYYWRAMAFDGSKWSDGWSSSNSFTVALTPSTIVFTDGQTVSKMIGSGVYTNVVSGVGDGVVTYTSGTPATATVDVNTGEVTLVAVGTTVITASKVATATHASVTNTYTLKVEFFVGYAYQGGKIAYILVSGDPGYDAAVQHGLIAATADQGTGRIWALDTYQSTTVPGGATGWAIGTGLANTNAIVAQNGAGSTYAAGLCDAYTNTDTGTGVYYDWYLPSHDELKKLYLNQGAIGGFGQDIYWSSTEVSSNSAYQKYFYNGYGSYGRKYDDRCVRPVRAF